MKRLRFSSVIAVLSILQVAIPIFATAETVLVKYRGAVDLAPFECESTPQSSVVKRLCYDSKEKYVIVNLSGTYYHYCEVPANIVRDWRKAESLGSYYNQHIKGQYDCRVLYVPQYKK
jgi:hypothetical protein